METKYRKKNNFRRLFITAASCVAFFLFSKPSNESIYKKRIYDYIGKDIKINFDYRFAKVFYNDKKVEESAKAFSENLYREGKISLGQKYRFIRSANLIPLIHFHSMRICGDISSFLFSYVATSAENDFTDKISKAGAITKWQLLPSTAKWLVNVYGKRDPYFDKKGIKYDKNGEIIWISDENALILHLYYIKYLKENLKLSEAEDYIRLYNAYVCGPDGNKNLRYIKHIKLFVSRIKDLELLIHFENFIENYRSQL